MSDPEIYTHHFGKPVPLTDALEALASQENCDGDEGAVMQAAATQIRALRKALATSQTLRDELDDQNEELRDELNTVKAQRNSVQKVAVQFSARVTRLEQALKPFAEFARSNVDDTGWSGREQRAAIHTWFGPSDFREAYQAYTYPNHTTSTPETTQQETEDHVDTDDHS